MRISLICLLTSILLLATINCQPESAEEIENKIARSEQLTKLNELCGSLPKLPSMKLKFKKISGNSDISSLYFYYERDIPWKDLMLQYDKWLSDNDWVKNEDTISGWYGTYNKGLYRIAIETNNTQDVSIGCMKLN